MSFVQATRFAFAAFCAAVSLSASAGETAPSDSAAAPSIIRDQVQGATRLAEYGLKCGVPESDLFPLRQLVQVERQLFGSIDSLRKLHLEAKTHQEALIRIDQLPKDLESAASRADVEAGYRAGMAEVAAHGPLSAMGCETVRGAVVEGNKAAQDAVEHLGHQQRKIHELIASLADTLRSQRQAASKH